MKKKRGRYAKKNSNQKFLTALVVGLSLILIVLLVILIKGCQNEPMPEQTLPPLETTLPLETTQLQMTGTGPEENPSTALTTLSTETTAPGETTEPEQTEPAETKPKETEPPVKPTVPPEPTETGRVLVTFPYVIPDTELVIRYVDSYSGIFIEDGSDVEANGITAMVVTNLSNTHIEYANISLTRNGKVLAFSLSALPAGATMVVQEANATAYTDGEYYDCVCEVAEIETLEMSESLLRVEEDENGALVVTNLTDKTIPTIRIFYKFYMSDEDVYVGGITYTAKIQDLGGGASCVVSPSHYLAGGSQVVMVRTYDTVN